jgi:hypothetical protein
MTAQAARGKVGDGGRWPLAAALAMGFLVRAASAAALAPDPAWTADGDQRLAAFGVSVAAADLNADGFTDVLVGASLFDGPWTDGGRILLYYGTSLGPQAKAGWSARGPQAEAWLGFTVSPAGDVNGDGFEDLAAGAHGFDYAQVDQGAAFVWLGSPSGPGAAPDWMLRIDQREAFLGKSLDAAGDVNADGYDDIIVGAWGFTNGEVQEGAAFVFLGSAAAPAAPAWSFESDQAFALAGFVVAGAGDVNGDGHADVLVGSHNFDAAAANDGRVWLFLGSPEGVEPSAAWTAAGEEAGALFGFSVGGAGDVNGDGHDDILVGAPRHDGGLVDQGRAYLYLGSAAGPSGQPAWVADGGVAGAELGLAAAAGGDVNHDGFADVLVGAPRHNAGGGPAGRARLYLGSPAGLQAEAAWAADGERSGDYFAGSLGAAADVNGDGHGDVVVGAQAAEDGGIVEGRAYVFLGTRPNTFPLRVASVGSGSGAVRSDPAGIDCGAACVALFPDGEAVSLQALPAPGSLFFGWRGDGDCRDGQVTMAVALRCDAVFYLEGETCPDADADGFGAPGSYLCPSGPVEDCDDASIAVRPGGAEVCDGGDNDCDGLVDRIDCGGFDVNGDGRIDGVELAWMGRAFGAQSADPASEWWFRADYTRDGAIDGDDLGILGARWSCEGLLDACE